jgi:hypothetical protein
MAGNGLSRLGRPRLGRVCGLLSHPALVALALAVLVLAGASLFADGNLNPGVREDRGNRWVMVEFPLIGLLDACLPAYADGEEFWTIDGDTIRWLGVVFFAAGDALGIWPVFVLGRRFSGRVAIQAGHALVTSGVYGVSATPAIWGCSSTRRGGPRLSFGARCAAHGAPHTASSPASVRKSGCCGRSLLRPRPASARRGGAALKGEHDERQEEDRFQRLGP